MEELSDPVWLADLAFLVDITKHLNALNVKLQGQDAVVSQLYAHIKAIGTKLQLFHRHLSQTEPCTAHFPALKEVIDSFPQDNIVVQMKSYATAIASLSTEFNKRFQDFAVIEKDMLLFSSPFSVDPDDAPPQLQLELIELQCDDERRADSIRNLTMKLLSVFILLAPQLISAQLLLPVDCSDIYNNDNTRPSGVYTIYPIGATSAVQVFCDMDSQGGRWTVFQRRMDGSVNFYRPWDHYKTGFGTAAGEYWLGLENLFHLTLRKKYELLVDMEDFEGNKAYARYSSFSVGPEIYGYTLEVSGFTDGGAGDSMRVHNGHKFSTFDKDQDIYETSCAKEFLGGFWYTNCHHANPNGVYRWGAGGTLHAIGVEWYTWKGHNYSLKSISMKIRPVQ
ncbi:microfibril-associated glycoprotein 4-like [Halichoeres trimaculatus]|uniref:microfibril-associated glycoprotein 4-like n=1 Tax=Halichoeres trimaculatus TaxID=147232 RepID=UPI003D9F58F9